MELVQPEIWRWRLKSIALLAMSGALQAALENPRERMIFVLDRTHIRSRSPRLKASRQLEACR